MLGTSSVRLPAAAQDVVLALFVTVMQVQGVSARFEAEGTDRSISDLAHLGVVLLVVPGVALVVRLRWPVPVLVVAAASSVCYYALDFSDGPGWLALFVALYTVAARGDGRRSVLLAGTTIAALTVVWLVTAQDTEPRAAIGWVFFRIGAAVMSAALGESVRSRRVIAAEAIERAERAEQTREEEARARVDAERLRIAREVHDTVAHAIAIINVQAGVTAHVLDKRPERARETLQAIEQTSAQALREMRAILGVLRDDTDERAPHPGLDDLDELAAQARDAGLDVKVETGPSLESLPTAVGSAAYRIVQESLTNVIRHVGPTRVRIALESAADELRVHVVDEGRSGTPGTTATAGADAPGRGILGMRERCQLLGGELEAGPVRGGGFAVTARLPLAATGTAYR